MHRSVRVPNPYFKGIPVDWKLKLPKTDQVNAPKDGELTMSFRTRDDNDRKTEFTFPCVVSRKGCFVKKDGTMKKIDAEDKCVSTERFSVIGRIDEDPKNKSILIFNDIIEAVARHCGHAISTLRELASSYDGTMVVPPKLFRIPKIITFKEISLEKLRETGQI